jgi:CopZ-like zinc binding protein
VSDCCQNPNEDASLFPAKTSGNCLACGKKGEVVSTLTVKSLVRDHVRVEASASYLFCRTANCEVVYFGGQVVFKKSELKVRVGIKETVDPIPLCYCFDYSRADIRREIDTATKVRILDKIKLEVQGGFCACEVKNPRGSCCLGDITRAIQEARGDSSQSSG